MEQKINSAERNRIALDLYLEYFQGEQVIIYASGTMHADALEGMFSQAGVATRSIHSKKPTKYNDDAIDAFGKKEFDVLINAQMLIEGYDHHGIQGVFCMSPSQSRVVVGQSRPRGMTPDPESPNKICTIFEFVDQEAARPALLFEELAMIDHGETIENDSFHVHQLRDALREVSDIVGKPRDFSDASKKIGARVLSEDEEVKEFFDQREATARTQLRFK